VKKHIGIKQEYDEIYRKLIEKDLTK